MSGEYTIIDETARSKPTEEVIAGIRKRYPTETEIDTIYTRKMRRRNGPGYQAVTLDCIIEGGQALIEARLGYPVRIEDARWMSGGASKLQVVFDLHWKGEDSCEDNAVDRMVLRMEPAASVTESSRRREFEVLKAVDGVIPAP